MAGRVSFKPWSMRAIRRSANGMKCRDNKLHDETYLKENLEKLFNHRQATGFVPLTPEPPEDWLGGRQVGIP